MLLTYLYGTYTSRKHISRPAKVPCFDCGTEDNLSLDQEVKTFHLFYLPLFPYHVRDELS